MFRIRHCTSAFFLACISPAVPLTNPRRRGCCIPRCANTRYAAGRCDSCGFSLRRKCAPNVIVLPALLPLLGCVVFSCLFWTMHLSRTSGPVAYICQVRLMLCPPLFVLSTPPRLAGPLPPTLFFLAAQASGIWIGSSISVQLYRPCSASLSSCRIPTYHS